MTYTFAGFTFAFTQNADGLVTDITFPQLGPILTAYTLHLDTAQTVAGAEALVQGVLAMLGIHP